jgi:sulfur carrier protein
VSGEAPVALPLEGALSPNNCAFDNVARLCYEFAVKVEWEGKIHEIEKRVTVERLLDMFRLSREAHLVSANGALVTEDHMLEPDDRVRIIRVISGG